MLLGIDVSNWQGAVDWGRVAAAGYGFGLAKASEGVGYADPWFAGNWEGLRAAGLVRGAYHFARPSRNPPGAEAAWFVYRVEAAGGLAAGDLLALDLEDPGVAPDADLLGWALAWVGEVEGRTGVTPLLYSGRWYLEPRGLAGGTARHRQLGRCPLWLAAYQEEAPAALAPWERVVLWQRTDAARVPGVQGACDEDVLLEGGAEELRALGWQGAAGAGEPEGLRARVAELETRLGYLGDPEGGVAGALRRAVAGLRGARTRAEREAAIAAVEAATDTLEREATTHTRPAGLPRGDATGQAGWLAAGDTGGLCVRVGCVASS
jgi:lysozyme